MRHRSIGEGFVALSRVMIKFPAILARDREVLMRFYLHGQAAEQI